MGRVGMVDKNNLIKNSLDNELKDIYVTKELKLKTLSKIKKEDNLVKPFRRKNKISYVGMKGLALVSSVLIMFFTFSFFKYNKFMNNESPKVGTDNNRKSIVLDDKGKEKQQDKINKKEDGKDTKDEKIEGKISNKDSLEKGEDTKNLNEQDSKHENKETTNPNKNVKKPNEEKPNKEKPKPNEEKEAPKLTEKQMIARAENLWGGKINLPSYIPKGYDVTNIDMETAYGSKVLKITYKDPSSDNFLELKVLEGDKTAFQGESGSKNLKEDEKGNNDKQDIPNKSVESPTKDVKSVNSNKNGVEYNIEGNISSKTLEKVAESIEE